VRVVEEARKLLAQFEHLKSVASRAQNGEIGHLTIGCVTTYKKYLVECVQTFSQKYPDVRLEFQSMGTDEQAKALKQARIHVGFVILPLQSSELAIERISSEPWLLGLSANHPLARRRRVPLTSRPRSDSFFLLANCVLDRMIKSSGRTLMPDLAFTLGTRLQT